MDFAREIRSAGGEAHLFEVETVSEGDIENLIESFNAQRNKEYTLIAKSSSEEIRGRAFGLHRTMDTLGAMIGVLLAYYFITREHLDFRQIFLYSLIPAVMGVMALFFVREKGVAKISKERPSLNWKALDRRLKSFLMEHRRPFILVDLWGFW